MQTNNITAYYVYLLQNLHMLKSSLYHLQVS